MEGRESRQRADEGGRAALVRCPFFRRHSPSEIRCEGVMDGTSMSINFARTKRKAWYEQTYCEDNYRMCEVYQLLMEHKYSDD